MRVLIAGTSSDVGKTTVVLGIMRALKNRGIKVQGYKAGPDYIDTAFHTFATGIPSRNLDTWMMDNDTINQLIAQHSHDSDIAIIEGVMGLFDGENIKNLVGSSAHLAKITKTPVVLVIDGSGVAASAAAMVLGFRTFDKSIDIKGVIVNKVSGDRHYQIIKEAIEYHVGIPCIGYLKKQNDISLKSRHLGLIPSVEVEALDDKINQVAAMVESTINLDQLMTVGKTACITDVFQQPEKKDLTIRLGVAKDSAFNFYYQDNLDLLERLGCELVTFSPIHDKRLPENLDGLYIGGGFPEVFADALEANEVMRLDIKRLIEEELPTYAECGGLMYLTDYIETLEGKKYKMVGIFENGSKMTNQLQRFGYVEGEFTADTPLGEKGSVFKGHEFHRSMVHDQETVNMLPYSHYKMSKSGNKSDFTWQCGYMKYNCLGGYAHIHFYSQKSLAENFVLSCQKYKSRRQNEK